MLSYKKSIIALIFILLLIAGVFFWQRAHAPSPVLSDDPAKETMPGISSDGQKECVITGCSSHICAEEDVMSICEYREEYACYAGASCERQADGRCGWTQTAELAACLSTKGGSADPSPANPQPEIPANCAVWYDGCNTCQVGEDGLLACTLRLCEQQEAARCVEFK